MKKKFLKLSLITLITGIDFLIIAFFVFHYVTDVGITNVWQAEAQKPYITELIGDFAVINIATSFISFLISVIFFNNKNSEN